MFQNNAKKSTFLKYAEPDAVDCGDPGDVPHGKRIRRSQSGPFPIGTVISYVCFTGFGGGDITCQEGGIWTQRPTCNSSYVGTVYCGDPGQVQSAYVWTGPFQALPHPHEEGPSPIGTRLTYTCELGYTGGGSSLCQPNGQWTPRPACIFATGKTFV